MSPQQVPPPPEPAPIYTAMREMVLALVPGEAGLAPSSQPPHVWGLLTEMGFPDGSVTLVSLADGTTSMYFSGGGGLIGCGGHAAVAAASRALVAEAERLAASLAPTDAFPLPAAGRVRFYLLALDGKRTAEAGQEELADGRHPLAPLFLRSDEVVGQVRRHSPAEK